MSSGTLIQLVATGPQSELLAGPGGRDYFAQHRVKARGGFATESIEQTLEGGAGFGRRPVATIARRGDLVRDVVLEVTFKRDSSRGDAFYPAEHFVKSVRLEIGEQIVDEMTNTWLRLYDELYRPVDKREAHASMTTFDADDPDGTVRRFYLQLPFWFCTDPGSALPLVALHSHEVRLRFEFEDAANIPGIDVSYAPEVSLSVDYVYLGKEERKAVACGGFDHLVEQTYRMRGSITPGESPATFSYDLLLNHPVKYLAWVLKPSEESHGLFTPASTGLVASETYAPLAEATLQVNGSDRLRARKGSYFRLQHPASTFGRAPSAGVYAYSFAMHPTRGDPSGTLDCSRVDSLRLRLTTKAAVLASASDATAEDQTLEGAANLTTVEIYARAYNVLRFGGKGLGGLLFPH